MKRLNRQSPPQKPSLAVGGFTLVELLVAISILALMAVLAWRGLDGMQRAQRQTKQASVQVAALQVGLAQWVADLDALAQPMRTPSLDWDGRALRMVRRGATPGEGLRVVAWTYRSTSNSADGTGQWLRWQSAPLTTNGQFGQAWQQAALWAKNPSDQDRQREVRVVALDGWQIYFYRNNAWSNPLSSAEASTAGLAPPTPEGVRLVLDLAPGQTISGSITRDWLRSGSGGVL